MDDEFLEDETPASTPVPVRPERRTNIGISSSSPGQTGRVERRQEECWQSGEYLKYSSYLSHSTADTRNRDLTRKTKSWKSPSPSSLRGSDCKSNNFRFNNVPKNIHLSWKHFEKLFP